MLKIVLAGLTVIALTAPSFAQDTSGAAVDSVVDSVINEDTLLGTTMQEVRNTLTEMGYEVRKSEMEGGKMEVYFVGNGKMGEVYVSPVTGKPTKIVIK